LPGITFSSIAPHHRKPPTHHHLSPKGSTTTTQGKTTFHNGFIIQPLLCIVNPKKPTNNPDVHNLDYLIFTNVISRGFHIHRQQCLWTIMQIMPPTFGRRHSLTH